MANKIETPESKGGRKALVKPAELRRDFLRNFALFGGAALIYAVPAVKALAESGAPMSRGRALQIPLPSTYSFTDKKTVLQVTRAGERSVPVKFKVEGRVRLSASGRDGIANIEIISMRAVSVSTNPIPSEGGRGQITASVNGARAGQLDLRSGRVISSGAEIPTSVSYSGERMGRTGKVGFGGSVAVISSTGDGPAGIQNCECLNGNDVSARIMGPKGPTVVSGHSELISRLVRG